MRRLGPLGASALGLSSMVGAGVFYVWGPASALAGSLVLVSLVIAGVIALLNALSMAQLALHNPVSGGAYRFGQTYVSPRVGFLAGSLFLAGKTSSVAAIALIAASYLAPSFASVLAAGLVALFAAANITGIRTTAGVSIVSVVVVLSVLAVVVVQGFGGPLVPGTTGGGEPLGVLSAAGLMFFAFAGYARMATLGGEVKNPRVVVPRVIIWTLLGVLGLYSLLGYLLVTRVGTSALAQSLTPLAELVSGPWQIVVIAGAALAGLGSLAAILAGLSRTSMAMAQSGDLPRALGYISPKTQSPVVAEATMAVAAMMLVISVDPVWLVGASSGCVLGYYAIAHLSALRQPVTERIMTPVLPWVGLVGCVVLVVTLPWQSLVITAAIAAVAMVLWQVTRGGLAKLG